MRKASSHKMERPNVYDPTLAPVVGLHLLGFSLQVLQIVSFMKSGDGTKESRKWCIGLDDPFHDTFIWYVIVIIKVCSILTKIHSYHGRFPYIFVTYNAYLDPPSKGGKMS